MKERCCISKDHSVTPECMCCWGMTRSLHVACLSWLIQLFYSFRQFPFSSEFAINTKFTTCFLARLFDKKTTYLIWCHSGLKSWNIWNILTVFSLGRLKSYSVKPLNVWAFKNEQNFKVNPQMDSKLVKRHKYGWKLVLITGSSKKSSTRNNRRLSRSR